MSTRHRDYWSRPVRSDRTLHDYGNTHLTPSEPSAIGWRSFFVIVLLVGLFSAIYAYVVMGH